FVADGRVLQDAISRRHGLKVPHGKGYQPSTLEEFFNMKHASARNVIERCFGLDPIEAELGEGLPSNVIDDDEPNIVPEEDDALVACMVDLHNVGTFNADTGFKACYLNELEKMLEKVLPNAMLKAKLNLESRIRTLKRDWSIIYDMLSGKNNSGFGWNEHRQLVVAEDASHKEAGQFKHHSFPYYDQLTAIYAKDRATRKNAQTAADIIEEIDVEDVATTNTHEERNDFYGFEAEKKKNSNASDHISSTSFHDAATLLAENIRTVGVEISRSIASEVLIQQKSEMTIQERALTLYPTLCEVEGLTEDERYHTLSKIPDHLTQMLIFFSLPPFVRLE
ncbi:hypothetical protein Gotur_024296, partial [Gossypium turneri]